MSTAAEYDIEQIIKNMIKETFPHEANDFTVVAYEKSPDHDPEDGQFDHSKRRIEAFLIAPKNIDRSKLDEMIDNIRHEISMIADDENFDLDEVDAQDVKDGIEIKFLVRGKKDVRYIHPKEMRW